jgi:hypothetical protein
MYKHLTTVLLVFALIPFVSIADEISKSDKKEIIQILFKLFIESSEDNLPQTILLDPRIDVSIMPDIPGVVYKKLKYGEEGLVPEYFAIHFSPEDDRTIIAGILRGNGCQREGQTYEFHKVGESWAEELHGYVSSRSDFRPCPACKLEPINVEHDNVLDQHSRQVELQGESLQITGKVQSIECKPNDSMTYCHVDVDFSLYNIAEHPVIIIKESQYYRFRPTSRILALIQEDLNPEGAVYSDYFGESLSTSENYSQLADLLETPMPPPDVTHIINPGERIEWTTPLLFKFYEENTCNGNMKRSVEIGWKSIGKLQAPLWLKVGCVIR